MKKGYLKFYDSSNHILGTKVVKGYKTMKGFKRYNLPYCFNTLTAGERRKWERLELYRYGTTDDLINGNMEIVGEMTRAEYKTK